MWKMWKMLKLLSKSEYNCWLVWGTPNRSCPFIKFKFMCEFMFEFILETIFGRVRRNSYYLWMFGKIFSCRRHACRQLFQIRPPLTLHGENLLHHYHYFRQPHHCFQQRHRNISLCYYYYLRVYPHSFCDLFHLMRQRSMQKGERHREWNFAITWWKRTKGQSYVVVY